MDNVSTEDPPDTRQPAPNRMASATASEDGQPPPAGPSPAAPLQDKWYDAMAGVIVATIGLLALLGIMALAILEMPDGNAKSTNIVALATAAFGVIGAVVGAYFGVRAANRAVTKMSQPK